MTNVNSIEAQKLTEEIAAITNQLKSIRGAFRGRGEEVISAEEETSEAETKTGEVARRGKQI